MRPNPNNQTYPHTPQRPNKNTTVLEPSLPYLESTQESVYQTPQMNDGRFNIKADGFGINQQGSKRSIFSSNHQQYRSISSLSPTQFVANMHLNSPHLKQPRKIHHKNRPKPNSTVEKHHKKTNKYIKIEKLSSSITTLSSNSNNSNQSLINIPAKLIHLGDWMRFTVSSLKLRKNIYNRSILLLRLSESPNGSSYPLAAASLSLILKFQSQQFLHHIRQLPPRQKQSRRLSLQKREYIDSQADILKAIQFHIPMYDSFLRAMLSVCQKWTLYVRSNIKYITLPLKYLQTGMQNQWQKRNTYNVSYLVDLLNLSPHINPHRRATKEWFGDQEVLLVSAAILLSAATNSCTTDKLNCNDFIVRKFLKGFLKKCYNYNEQRQLRLNQIVVGCCQQKVWQKLRLMPTKSRVLQKPVNNSEQEKLEWLDQLEYIPMCQQFQDM